MSIQYILSIFRQIRQSCLIKPNFKAAGFWPSKRLPQQAKVIVDDQSQASTLGELQWAPGTACWPLGNLLTGQASFERNLGDITIFDMTGLALQDLVLGEYLYKAARREGVGLSIRWPW